MRCHLLYDRFLPFISLDTQIETSPQRLDLRVNSKCNLQCKMCHNWKGESGVYQDYFDGEKFPQDFLQNLKEISLLGGEPFIQNSTFELINKVSDVNPNCLWLITTNLNYDFDKIAPYLKKMRLSTLQMSLDTLKPKVYSEIRRLGNFDLAMKNIDHFIAFRKEYELSRKESFRLQASFCIQKDNYQEIKDFLSFCKAKGINVHFQFAYQPYDVSLLSLPQEEQENILSYLIDLCDEDNQLELYPILAGLSKKVFCSSEES